MFLHSSVVATVMSERTRRALLGGTGALFLAGCIGGGSSSSDNNDSDDQSGANNEAENTEPPDRDDDGVPDAEDEFPDDSLLSEVISSEEDTRQFEEDEWWWYELEFPEPGQLSYDFIVREGPEIDVIVIEESEYSYFEEGERYEYLTGASTLDSAGDDNTEEMAAGSYRMIFDNTARGEAAPPTNFGNDVVEVEFEFTIAV